MDEDRTLHSLDFGFLSSFFHEKLFFPKFELLNSGCGLSASAAYLRVFTVIIHNVYMKDTHIQEINKLMADKFDSID